MIFSLALFFLAVAVANVLFWPRLRQADGFSGPGISVLIPARNEEANLPACLASVLAQGEAVAEILVYDDHSDDATASIAASYSDRSVRLVRSLPLPSGWYGKTFACAQLAEHAQSRWLLFLDADARLAPHACQRMLFETQSRRLTFLSCWPRFELESWAERLLMPMLNFVVFSVFPAPLATLRNDASLGLAHGACILAEREAYQRVGGHAAVRSEIFEDTRIAQLWRAAGERGLCLDGQGTVTVRMYSSFAEIWRGFNKNFYLAFKHPANFWAFLILHFCMFLLPFLGVSWRAAVAVLALRAVLAIRFGQGWWSVLAHPLAESVVIAIGLASWWNSRSKAGVMWKGRQYRMPRA